MHPRGRIDRYLAGDRDAATAARVREHLTGCASCRAHFDSEVQLLRALAGQPGRATVAEDARLVERALAEAGLAPPRPARGWLDRLLEHPFAYGAAALALVLLLVGGGLLFTRGGAQPAGRLMMATAVTIDGRAAAPGMEIRPGQRVHVGDKGIAEMAVERGGTVKAYPGADLRLARRGENVDLDLGRVWCEVDRDRGSFSVTTDRGVARVLGTSFVVERGSDGETDVRVMKGSVEVEDRERRGKVRVEANQRTRIGKSGGPAPARRYDSEDDRNAWERFFNDLGKAFERLFKGK